MGATGVIGCSMSLMGRTAKFGPKHITSGFLLIADIIPELIILRTRPRRTSGHEVGYGNLVLRLVAASIKSVGHWLEGWQQRTALSWFRGAVFSPPHFHWADRTKMGAANCRSSNAPSWP